MVSQNDKKQMIDFIANSLHNSGKYEITLVDNMGVGIIQKDSSDPKSLFIYTHHSKTPLNEFGSRVNTILNNFNYLSNIFYKDDKNFMVRLGSSATGRGSKSLKNYSHDQLNKMIHLRGLEKKVLSFQGGFNNLTYYQPNAAILNESLREFELGSVYLDYSHLDQSTYAGSFSKDGISEDYRIADEVLTPNANISFRARGRIAFLSPQR